MQFGSTVGTACLTFVITNIDDAFVLVTFFAESSTSQNLTPLKITLGQYVGFTIIMAVSLIGFAVAVALPSEPIGFLGLLPLLLGVWRAFSLLFPRNTRIEKSNPESKRVADVKSIFKVAIITVMNGGDNIGIYIPLFSQAKGAQIAVYVVVYYILLGIWCFTTYLTMKQKQILQIMEKHASLLIPFLFIGLGIYIVVKSVCYPWSVEEINNQFLGNPGQIVMGVTSAFLLSFVIGIMVWIKRCKYSRVLTNNEELAENIPAVAQSANHPNAPSNRSCPTRTQAKVLGDEVEEDKTRLAEMEPSEEHKQSGHKVQPQMVPGEDDIQTVSQDMKA